MRRVLGWLLAVPLAGAGVLVGHALAYRLTGASPGASHAYVSHLPQLAVVLATVGVAAGALCRGDGRRSRLPFATLAVTGFVLQEHVERLAHDGSLPMLLLDRTFLVGLALQIPVALVGLALARWVSSATRGGVAAGPRRSLIAWLPLLEPAPAAVAPRMPVTVSVRNRAPPRPA